MTLQNTVFKSIFITTFESLRKEMQELDSCPDSISIPIYKSSFVNVFWDMRGCIEPMHNRKLKSYEF